MKLTFSLTTPILQRRRRKSKNAEKKSQTDNVSELSPNISSLARSREEALGSYKGLRFELYAQHFRQVLPEKIAKLVDEREKNAINTTLENFENEFNQGNNASSIETTYKQLLREIDAKLKLKAADSAIHRWENDGAGVRSEINQYVAVNRIGGQIEQSFRQLGYMVDTAILAYGADLDDVRDNWNTFSGAWREHAVPDDVLQSLAKLRTRIENAGMGDELKDDIRSALRDLESLLVSTNGRRWLQRVNRIHRHFNQVMDLWRQWKKIPHGHRASADSIEKFDQLIGLLTVSDRPARTEAVSKAAAEFLDSLEAMERGAKTWLDSGGHKRAFFTSYNILSRRVFEPKNLRSVKKALMPFLHEKYTSAQKIDALWVGIRNVDRMPEDAVQAHSEFIKLLKPDRGKGEDPDRHTVSICAKRFLESIDRSVGGNGKRAILPAKLLPLREEVMKYMTQNHLFAYQLSNAWGKLPPRNAKSPEIIAAYQELHELLTVDSYTEHDKVIEKRCLLMTAINDRLIRAVIDDLSEVVKADFLRKCGRLRRKRDRGSHRALQGLLDVLKTQDAKPPSALPDAPVRLTTEDIRMRQMTMADRYGKKDMPNSDQVGTPARPQVVDRSRMVIPHSPINIYLSQNHQLLIDGMATLQAKFAADGDTHDIELSPATRESWYELLIALYRPDDPKDLKMALEKFAKAFEKDWGHLSTTPSPELSLHTYAENLIMLGELNNDEFNYWHGVLKLPTVETLDEALYRVLDYQKEQAPKGGSNRDIAENKVNRALRFLTVDIAIGTALAGRPDVGGFDFFGILSSRTLGPLFNLSLGLFQITSIGSLVATRIKASKLANEGKKLVENATKEFEYLKKYPQDSEISLRRIEQELKVSLGQTLKAAGVKTWAQDVQLTLNVLRRSASLGFAITALIQPELILGILIASILVNVLGGATSIYDHISASYDAVNYSRFESLVANKVRAMAAKTVDGEIDLNKGVERLLQGIRRGKRFNRSMAVVETAFTLPFFFDALNGFLKARGGTDTLGTGDVIREVLSFASNISAGLFCAWATVSVARDTYATVRLNLTEKKADRALLDLKEYNRSGGDQSAFNAYKMKLGKKMIDRVNKDIIKGMHHMPKTIQTRTREILSGMHDDKESLQGKAADSAPKDTSSGRIDEGRQFSGGETVGPDNTKEQFEQINTSALKTHKRLLELLPIIVESYEYDVGSKVHTSKQKFAHLDVDVINRRLGRDESPLSEKIENAHLDDENKMRETVFGSALPILYGVINTIDHNLSKTGLMRGRKGIQAASHAAEVSMGRGDLLGAARQLRSVYRVAGWRALKDIRGDFRDLVISTYNHLKMFTSIEAHASMLKELGWKGDPDQRHIDGLHTLSVANVKNEFMRLNPSAFPATILWMLQSRDPAEISSASNLLRIFGIGERTLSDLIQSKFSMETLDLVTQVMKAPHTLDKKGVFTSPVKDVTISTSSDLAQIEASNRLRWQYGRDPSTQQSDRIIRI